MDLSKVALLRAGLFTVPFVASVGLPSLPPVPALLPSANFKVSVPLITRWDQSSALFPQLWHDLSKENAL